MAATRKQRRFPPVALPPAGGEALAAALGALAAMDSDRLRGEWRRLFRVPAPPRVRRDLLLLGVGWKLQEKALGGLGAVARRRLAELARTRETDGDPAESRVVRLKPGARLVREWRGETHTVQVQDDGFEWRSRRFRSLSRIAREITGTRWSGPRFFGLEKRAKQAQSPQADDA